jgi:hypothetical protein
MKESFQQMQDILNKISDYNSIIFDIDNAPEWDIANIPHKLIDKQKLYKLEIYKTIIDYCINNNKLEKPVEQIINNIHDTFLKNNELPINLQLFKKQLHVLF